MASHAGKRWMREDLILAFNLYCKTAFGRIHMRNPDVVELARMLGRSPGAVSYKLANFARLDPAVRPPLQLAGEFGPDPELLAYHNQQCSGDDAP